MAWNSISCVSVLGAGWLGWPLARQLQKRGFRIKTSTTTPEKWDLLQKEKLNPCFLRVDLGMVVADDPAFFDTDLIILNIPPSRRRSNVETWYPQQIQAIVDVAKINGVGKILFISSTSVYGDVNAEVTEESIPQPDTPSARGILHAEEIIKEGFPDRASNILRMSGLIGGERKAGRFFAGKKGIPEGNAPVNLVHLEDCIGVIEALIEQEAWGKLYNVCADDHPRKADFYTAQALQEGFEPPVFLPDDTPRFKVVSNALLRRELNYSFKVKMKNEK